MSVKKQILCCFCFLICGISTMAQEVGKDTLFFEFEPKRNMFWSGYKRNALFLDSLYCSIRSYKPLIESGELKVRVLGFCSSYDTEKENRFFGKKRSNQVKSYFIIKNGLKESHFYTTNFISRWRGMSDVVAVTFQSQVIELIVASDTLPQVPGALMVAVPPEMVFPEMMPKTVSPVQPEKVVHPWYRWAVKTNVAYLAATVANLGVEYSFGRHYSIDVPVIYSPYTVSRSYRLRFLAVQPEFRYWLENPTKGHFFGAHLNIGAFNVSVDKKERYQSPDGFYGVGLSYGYALPLARHWGAEFTLGAGYVHTKYDTYYNIPDGARFEKGVSYNYWGLTKVGINLVYRF